MTDVTLILKRIEDGDAQASEKLLPVVYDELRKLARLRLSNEKPGQTLQATALVHEVYLKLVDGQSQPQWEYRKHFFCRCRRSNATDTYRQGAETSKC